jgi:hypothetical protein
MTKAPSRAVPLDWLRVTAALCMMGAGLMHLMIVPEHAEHAPAHGWFFAAAGVAQLAWAAIGWRRTRLIVDIAGMGMSVSLIALWAATRVVPAPFSTAPEAVDGAGVISKALEAGAFMALVFAAGREKLFGWTVAGTALGLAAAAGLYFGSRLIAPSFPSLWAITSPQSLADVGVHSHVSGQRVRMDDAPAGPWTVRVLTSPVPPRPGSFLVEVRVQDSSGRVRRDVTVWVDAIAQDRPGCDSSSSPAAGVKCHVRLQADQVGAKIPGEFAAQVPVDRSGIWLIRVEVDGADGQGQVSFEERVSSSLGLGGWFSALLPFAGLALLVLGYAALSRAFPPEA